MKPPTQSTTDAAGQARKRRRPPKSREPEVGGQSMHQSSSAARQARKNMRPRTEQYTDNEDPQAPSTQEFTTESNQRKRRGRPPKASNTQVLKGKKRAGVGVLVGDDGHTYLSSARSTVRVTESESEPSTKNPEVPGPRHLSRSPRFKGGKKILTRSELRLRDE